MLNTQEQVVEVEVIHRPATGQLVTLFGLNHVQSEHARLATRELGRALHWHRWFKPVEPNLVIMRACATEAGRRAFWDGLPYVVWMIVLPEARKVDEIWTAFRDAWFDQRDLDAEALA